MVALLVLVSPEAWAQDERTKEEKSADAAGCPIGVYVTSLRDLDPVGDSFGIDFWVWSVHPPGDNPLDRLEFVNAKQIETRLERTTQRGDLEWSRLKARATVLHDWDLTDFPFDRQTLTLDLGIAGSPGMVSDLGLGRPQAKTDVQNIRGRDRGALYFRMFFAEVRDRVVGSGHLDATMLDAASALLEDPNYWTQCWMMTAVWLRKSPA